MDIVRSLITCTDCCTSDLSAEAPMARFATLDSLKKAGQPAGGAG